MNPIVSISLLAAILHGQTPPSALSATFAPQDFTLVFKKSERYPSDIAVQSTRGTYRVIEKNRKLFIRDEGGAHPYWFLFDGQKSFCCTDPRAVTCTEGFAAYLIPQPIYLPFNTNAWKLYYPQRFFKNYVKSIYNSSTSSAGKRAVASHWLKDRSSNVSLLFSESESHGVFVPATLRTSSTANVVLDVGTSDKIGCSYSFYNCYNIGGATIAGEIVISFFEKNRSNPSLASEAVHVECKLIEAHLNAEGVPSIESLLKKGTFIAYQVDGVGKAGVAFDPEQGTFGHQLAQQLQWRKQLDTTKPYADAQSKSHWVIVPWVLSGVFFVLALYLIARQSIKARTS